MIALRGRPTNYTMSGRCLHAIPHEMPIVHKEDPMIEQALPLGFETFRRVHTPGGASMHDFTTHGVA